jgi:hypothetical protein
MGLARGAVRGGGAAELPGVAGPGSGDRGVDGEGCSQTAAFAARGPGGTGDAVLDGDRALSGGGDGRGESSGGAGWGGGGDGGGGGARGGASAYVSLRAAEDATSEDSGES